MVLESLVNGKKILLQIIPRFAQKLATRFQMDFGKY